MRDQDLSDKNVLKLVRFKVLFIKRGYEYAFPEQEALVHDDMDAQAFTSWKVAEFIQDLHRKLYKKPREWKDYPPPQKHPHDPKYVEGEYLISLPEEDKKFLRLYFEVLQRYAREPFEHDEEQIKVLKEIRDRLHPKREERFSYPSPP